MKRVPLGKPCHVDGTHAADRRGAGRQVLAEISRRAHDTRKTATDWRGTLGDAYRREIARLWAIALAAVRKASR
jgi:hypothetical protein